MRVIILNGALASGKTTLGKLLAEKLNGEFLDIDDEVEKLNEHFKWETEEEKNRDWLEARKQAAWKTNEFLTIGKDIIVVGPFFKKEEIAGFLKHIQKDADIFLYTLTAPLEERLKRNKDRKFPSPNKEIINQQKQIRGIGEQYGIEFENVGSVEDSVNKMIELVSHSKGKMDITIE